MNVTCTPLIPFSPSSKIPFPSLSCPVLNAVSPVLSSNTVPVNLLASAISSFTDGLESVSNSNVDLSSGLAFAGFEATSIPAYILSILYVLSEYVEYELISVTLSNVSPSFIISNTACLFNSNCTYIFSPSGVCVCGANCELVYIINFLYSSL